MLKAGEHFLQLGGTAAAGALRRPRRTLPLARRRHIEAGALALVEDLLLAALLPQTFRCTARGRLGCAGPVAWDVPRETGGGSAGVKERPRLVVEAAWSAGRTAVRAGTGAGLAVAQAAAVADAVESGQLAAALAGHKVGRTGAFAERRGRLADAVAELPEGLLLGYVHTFAAGTARGETGLLGREDM